jgi:integrase
MSNVNGGCCGRLRWTRGAPSAGVLRPKIVSEMLGHATIAITLDTYCHVLPNMQESAAKAMEDALS